ncbi:unnamed protein product [Dimorphilus gyrociliatus]|uniref:G-protein coupled receptors family 3 profile domain-containing protein n=1 Tax=Dimorphilus gyrociliatus TaxID=2664684 RepID=A0A7I8V8C0_9ANNE|nr:unnamed protein product [Dimorphilus gyrociliatus]
MLILRIQVIICRLLYLLQIIECSGLLNIFEEQKDHLTRERNEAHINIGLISSLQQQVDQSQCSFLNSTLQLAFIEGMYLVKKTIEDINESNDILPNITLGYVFIDNCNLFSKSVRNSVKFLPRISNQICTKSDKELEYYNITAVIPTTSSSDLVGFSALLSQFKIPQLATLSSSDELSDKVRFKYLVRIASPDKFQAQALVDFALEHEWNYISILYIEGSYGENGAKHLRKLFAKSGICIAVDEMISFDNSIEDFEKALKLIKMHPNSEIIIIFLYPKEISLFYNAMERAKLLNKKYILSSDALMYTAISNVGKQRSFYSFAIAFQTGDVPSARRKLTSINPTKYPNLIYIKQYWKFLFNCTWDTSINSTTKPCDPNANLSSINYKVSALSVEYDCLQIYVQAMQRIVQTFCPGVFGSDAAKCITGERILHELRTGTFKTSLGKVQFDNNGDIIGGYNIVQFVDDEKYNVIGKWSRERVGVELTKEIKWPKSYIPISKCSHPCPPKYYYIHKAVICCWDCRQCRNNEIVIGNRTGCEECPEFFWPDKEALECVAIEADYLKWSDFETIIILTLAIFGLFLSILITSFIIWKRNEKLIKASSIQLTAIILIGIKLCLMSTFLFLIKPNDTVCSLSRYLFNISNSLIYAPLIMKTNRVFRIFSSARKGNQSVKYTSNRFQVLMAFLLVLLQVILTLLSTIISKYTAGLRQKIRTESYVELQCSVALRGFIPSLSYNIVLASISSYYGFLTRKLPENFNEASYIFVSVSTTLFVWLVLLPTYFTTEIAKYQSLLLAATCLLNSLITLLCLFLPKLYAIWFIDEQNLKIRTVSLNTDSSVAPN